MTPPLELLSQLQAAWAVPVGTTDPRPSRLPMNLPVATEPCGVHLPPFDVVETPDKTRPGYFRTNCRLCGRFIGYRRPDATNKIITPKLGRRADKLE